MAVDGCAPRCTARPGPGRPGAAGSRARDRRARGPVSQPARRIAGGDEQRGVADDLGHRRAGRGHERGAAGQRLERREAEALLERRVGHRLGLAEERRAAPARGTSRAAGCCVVTPLVGRRVAHRRRRPSRPGRRCTSRRSGRSGAMRAKAAISAGTSLRGSSVPANARYGGRMPRPRSAREVVRVTARRRAGTARGRRRAARRSTGARGSSRSRSRSAVCSLTAISARGPLRGARAASGVKNATLLRSCHSG